MSVAVAITQNREALINAIIATADPDLGFAAEEVRQLVVGFVRLLEAAAQGDFVPRDEYISAVAPGLRAGGVPVSAAAAGAVRIAAAAAVVLGPAHLDWLAEFCADYTQRLIFAWSADP
jgi:hypothetical protein